MKYMTIFACFGQSRPSAG